MLAISSKNSEPVHWTPAVTEYCAAAFGESGGVLKFVQIVDELRLDMSEGKNIKKYLGALNMLEDKFPIGQAISTLTKTTFPTMNFVWGDSFRPRMKLNGHSIGFERVAVVFNLAATQSVLARDTDRSSPEGQKNAIALFQNAAGIFLVLRDQVVAACGADTLGPDLSDGAISMCASLMLAQAQALFYEKAVKDKSSKSLLAKLANQASQFYTTAIGQITFAPLNTHLDPSWLAHCKFQELLFSAAAHFQQAMADKPNVMAKLSGFGALVARLRLAREVANSVDSLALSPAVLSSINALKEAIKTELATIEYDNTNVYIEVVPDKTSLPPIGLVPAVKATHVSLADLVDSEYIAGFGQVIDGLAPPGIKHMAETLEGETSRVAHQLSVLAEQLRLDDTNVAHCGTDKPGSGALPDEAWSKIARIQILGGPLGLEGQLVLLHKVSGEAEVLAASIARAIEEEERDDKACRDRFGATRFNRTASPELTLTLRQQLSNYRSKLALAIETNKKVRDRIGAQERSLVNYLSKSREELDSAGQAQISSGKILADPAMEQLKQVCRAHIVAADVFRAEAKVKVDAFVHRYVVSPSVRIPELLKAGNVAAAYAETVVGEAEKACAALMDELRTEWTVLSENFDRAYAEMSARGTSEFRGSWVPALTSCASVVLQGFSDVGEGLTFFGKLNDYLLKLKAQVEDYCFARNEEKTAILQNIQRTITRDSGASDDAAPKINFGQQ